MASDKPRRPRIRIQQSAQVINNTSGPITISGVTAYDKDDNPITQVGIEIDADADE